MTSVELALRRVADLARTAELRWALVGGIAVSVRTEPRFTRDVDLAVEVTDDHGAERVVELVRAEGYTVEALVEQESVDRLAAARLRAGSEPEEPYVDLLFASSGIEPEIVAAAETLEVVAGLELPVARPEHLLATKLLAADEDRPQDSADAVALLASLRRSEVESARAALRLITERGFDRGRDLSAALDELVGA